MNLKGLYTLKDHLCPPCCIFIVALATDQSYYTRVGSGIFPAAFPFFPTTLSKKQTRAGDLLGLLQKAVVYLERVEGTLQE